MNLFSFGNRSQTRFENVSLSRGMSRRSRQLAGFTLPEVLAVIAVVMIIISILLPAFVKSKEVVYDAKCKNNLSQIVKTMSMFKAQNNGFGGSLPSPLAWQTYIEHMDVGVALRCPKDGRDANQESAGSLSGSGTINYLSDPPSDVRFDALESNTQIFVFRERESFALPKPVQVDISNPGFVDHHNDYSPATIPAGVEVDSFFLHYDSVGHQRANTSGSVTVRGQIIGVIVEDNTLNDSDSIVGAEGTQYPTGQGARGFEAGAEKITLSDDLKTIEINQFRISFPGEEMRILTVPGGFSSYGMNNQVPQQSWARGRQIMFAEYDKSVIDVDNKNGNNDDLDDWLAPRHFEKANAIYGDGSLGSYKVPELNPSANQKNKWIYNRW